MRWQEALTGEARRDFESFLDTQRQCALERLCSAKGDAVAQEQEYIRALDTIRQELTKDEREAEAHADYTERNRGLHARH